MCVSGRPRGSWHLPPYSQDAVKDMHFRLLRYDCVEPLREAVAAVCAAGGISGLVSADQQNPIFLQDGRIQVMSMT